jgi:4-amino-4-deoxy-L-arabinose transferase-like glycosyltransferase
LADVAITISPATDDRKVWRLALAISMGMVAVQLALGAVRPLDGDESYYWDWSRRLAPGYFDHPPAIALLIRIGTGLAGATFLGVRLAPVLCNLAGAVAILLMTRRLGGSAAALRAALVMACMPMTAAWLVLATPDNPLFVTNALALLAVDRALAEPARSRSALTWWVAGGIALGLALQSKEMAVLLPLGVLLTLVTNPHLRHRLAEPGLYAAAGIALAIASPMIVWNLQNDSPFRYHLRRGLGAGGDSPLAQLLHYFGSQLGMGSGILFVLMVVTIIHALRRPEERSRYLLAVVALTCFGFFLVSALRRWVEANWLGPAYTAGIVLLAISTGDMAWRRWLRAGYVLGAAIVLLFYLQWLHPILPFPPGEDPVRRGHGWDVLAASVARARDSVEPPRGGSVWVAGNRFQDASQLAFHLPDHPTVFSPNLGDRSNQYAWWPGFPDLARPGDHLVFLLKSFAEEPYVVEQLAPHFDRVTRGERVIETPERRDQPRRQIWVLEGWRGTWPVIGRPAP